MLNRILTFAAGFFVYVATLLCFVQVPPQVSKPQLAVGFAAVALICAAIALARKRFAGWERTLAAILIGGSLVTITAVTAITVLRTSDSVRKAMSAGRLDGFSDYRTGADVTLIVLAVGGVLALMGRRGGKV
jgi:4-amino-4-deoxy-L-arabinose transferase-like glycosyltransferase